MLGWFVCVNNAEINWHSFRSFYATYYLSQDGYLHANIDEEFYNAINAKGGYFDVNITEILRIFFSFQQRREDLCQHCLFLWTMLKWFVHVDDSDVVYLCEWYWHGFALFTKLMWFVLLTLLTWWTRIIDSMVSCQ